MQLVLVVQNRDALCRAAFMIIARKEDAQYAQFSTTTYLNEKSPCRKTRASSSWDLAVSYSHMGKPHTTIGANTFHF